MQQALDCSVVHRTDKMKIRQMQGSVWEGCAGCAVRPYNLCYKCVRGLFSTKLQDTETPVETTLGMKVRKKACIFCEKNSEMNLQMPFWQTVVFEMFPNWFRIHFVCQNGC